MLWGPPLPDDVAAPAAMEALLTQALARAPDNPLLHAKLGYFRYDRHDYPEAAESLGEAVRLGGGTPEVRALLARCCNLLHRHDEALAILAPVDRPCFERGSALLAAGDAAGAERELRAVLDARPDDPQACRMLCRLLRREGRHGETAALCEQLAARGAANAQLLYNWAWALALLGETVAARRLLPLRERIVAIDLDAPPGFASVGAFNDALAEEILSNPNRVTRFAEQEDANRGSSRVDNLFSGRRPALIGALIERLQDAVADYSPAPLDGPDPWPAARPGAARLRPWGLIQHGGDYEERHIHPGGWLTGVYYVRVPAGIGRDGAGCIEFGPPRAIAEAFPDLAPPLRYVPREGMLLLSPSHYEHRTIPSGLDADRISVAFDVVPDSSALG
ncbi:MAG TPA: putative 2OG-Fe(II) oxygenase [Allosphingosinicella sp.]|jgi:Flp pilus assembly protein TadD